LEQVASELSSAAAQPIMTEYWASAAAAAVLGALFASGTSTLAETPLTRIAVYRDEVEGAKKKALTRYLRNPTRVLSRWLVGRIACTALAAVLIGRAVQPLALEWAALIAVLGTLGSYGLLTEVGITVTRRNPSRALIFLLRLLYPIELLTIVVAWPLEAVARLSGRLMPPSETATSRMTEHEVGLLLAEGQRAGTLEEEHAQMIKNVLEFEDLTTSEVMIPRTSVIAIDAQTTVEEVLRVISAKGHSRYPVYRESVDNIVGLLYAKDLFRVLDDRDIRAATVERFIRSPVNFVPEAQPVVALLREMRARRLHMAVVVDDYGGVSGIVTLEDIIEEIIGDIQDEHDVEEEPFVDIGDGRVLADAAVPVDELSQFLGVELPEDGDFVSLGGLLIHQAGQVPRVGAEIEAYGLQFIVREADERRISKVEVRRKPNGQAGADESTAQGLVPTPTLE
jgi:CBS domain containing-hemolysin-like protein